MRSAKVGMLPLLLVIRRPLRAMQRPLLPMQRPFLAMLRPFAATRCQGGAAGHEESARHHGICPLSDPFRGRGSECVGMHRPLSPMLRPFTAMHRTSLAMLDAFAATLCEGEDAIHEESGGHHALH
jgi:hypothetical protein